MIFLCLDQAGFFNIGEQQIGTLAWRRAQNLFGIVTGKTIVALIISRTCQCKTALGLIGAQRNEMFCAFQAVLSCIAGPGIDIS